MGDLRKDSVYFNDCDAAICGQTQRRKSASACIIVLGSGSADGKFTWTEKQTKRKIQMQERMLRPAALKASIYFVKNVRYPAVSKRKATAGFGIANGSWSSSGAEP